jgi:hypothetical protein
MAIFPDYPAKRISVPLDSAAEHFVPPPAGVWYNFPL